MKARIALGLVLMGAVCSAGGANYPETREYLLGDIDGFVYEGTGSEDDVYVDADWREWVENEAVGYNGNPVTLRRAN
ncbi:unnamed protein product, partial [marine sediment metagenome]